MMQETFLTDQRREKEMRKIYTMIIISIICLSTFSMLAPQAKTASLPPVGYWKFDEGTGTIAIDSSGNGNTGTLTNGPQWVDGRISKALSFDGQDDYVEVPDSDSLDFTQALTLELWFKPHISISAANPIHEAYALLEKWHGKGEDPQSRTGYCLTLNIEVPDLQGSTYMTGTGTLGLCMGFGWPAWNFPHSAKSSWNAGRWYHVAVTYDNSLPSENVRFYVDGILDSSYDETRPLAVNTLPFYINMDPVERQHLPESRCFPGTIDEVKIYNCARTAEELWNDYIAFKVGLPWRDDFNYSTLTEKEDSGWTLQNKFMMGVDGANLILDNDGGLGCEAMFMNFRLGYYDWRAETSGMWIGRSYGSLAITVYTERHQYIWFGDGFYPEFVFARDQAKILRFGGYTPQMNTWMKFTMEKRDNTIYLYLNDELKNTYVETDSAPDAIIGVELKSGWVATTKYDYISVTAPTPLSAEIDIGQGTLNLGSSGQWITCYVELPEGYNPADINPASILLNDTIAPVLDPDYDFVTNSSEYLVDHDGDGITERMIKFDRATVETFILNAEITDNEVALTITGELYDGTSFTGTDNISLIYPIHGHPGKPSKR
jgi:hypothetical protein